MLKTQYQEGASSDCLVLPGSFTSLYLKIGCKSLIFLPLCRLDRWQLGGIIILVHSPVDAADISINVSPASRSGTEDTTTEASKESGLLEQPHGSATGVLVRAKMEYQVTC